MNICFAPKGILQIDDARIIFKNFEGRGDKFNREGDRNFSLLIEDENTANALIKEGWNVKIKPGREEGDIDKSYYRALADKAVAFVSEYGDFERFIADEPYAGTPGIDFPPDDDELPWYSNEELKEILKAQDEEQEDLFRKR